jgi:hypothetical protein
MKLSDFEIVAKVHKDLTKLQAARDAVRYGTLTLQVGDGSDRYDLGELTSVRECREAVIEILDRHINDNRAVLRSYGVETDG